MAGLAAIEIAQKVSKTWRSLQADWKHSNRSSKSGKRHRRKERISLASQNRGGAGCSTSSSSETSASYGSGEDRSSSRPMMSWQDVYSLAVKWRQISEPCDPVVWVNKLRSAIFNLIVYTFTKMFKLLMVTLLFVNMSCIIYIYGFEPDIYKFLNYLVKFLFFLDKILRPLVPQVCFY